MVINRKAAYYQEDGIKAVQFTSSLLPKNSNSANNYPCGLYGFRNSFKTVWRRPTAMECELLPGPHIKSRSFTRSILALKTGSLCRSKRKTACGEQTALLVAALSPHSFKNFTMPRILVAIFSPITNPLSQEAW